MKSVPAYTCVGEASGQRERLRDRGLRVVECGVGDDVDTVIVDGRICMEGGVILGVDFARLREEAQAAGEQVWDTLAEWDPLGRSAEDACPWSYPLVS